MKNFLQFSIIGFLLFTFQNISAQVVGGDNVYEFLNMPSSARITALGGNLITVSDDDVALGFGNPASLNTSMHQQLSFNYNFHLAGINNGYFAYGHHIDKWKTSAHFGVQYINYGEFDAADELGNITGSFKAAEYAITTGGSYQLYEKMTVGANLKLISSQLESYNSLGFSTDLAAMYQDTAGRFTATFVVKNLGNQFTTYREDNREYLPFDIQLGVSKRLKHLPFRFSVIAYNLQRWNVLYDDPNVEDETFIIDDTETNNEQTTGEKIGIQVDNFFRHIIFNGEFLFGKRENFRLRFGYNHLRRQELTVKRLRSLAGFSFGVGIKISRFRIEFGQGVYHLAGGASHLSISTNLSEFKKKR